MPRIQAALVSLGWLTIVACSGGSASGGADAGDGSIADGTGNEASNDASTIDSATDGATPGEGAVEASSEVSVPPPTATCTPPIALADTSTPTATIGTGTAASCTESALASAVANGGVVVFDCGAAPTTIALTKPLAPTNHKDVVIDGGGTVTLDGGGATQILSFNGGDYRTGTTKITLQRLTLTRGKATGTKSFAPATAPCSQGLIDGSGGAVYVRDGLLNVIDVAFIDNHAATPGPDVGGGAFTIQASKGGAVVVGSTFTNNDGSNGGGIYALNAELAVYNSVFSGNAALGTGGNSVDAKQCPSVTGNQIGSGGNGGAIVIDGGDDVQQTACGVVFKNNSAGAGGIYFRTPDGAVRPTTIDRCTFDSNQGQIGCAYIRNSDLQILASTFSNNTGSSNGCLRLQADVLDMENDTITGNSVGKGLGGGLFIDEGSTGTILNCTVADNHADGGPGYFGGGIWGSGPTLKNTIVDDNTSKDANNPASCGFTPYPSGGGVIQWPAPVKCGTPASCDHCTSDATVIDPMLGALADNGGPVKTMLPATGSAAIGIGSGCPATDATGRARPTKCAAGAVEPK